MLETYGSDMSGFSEAGSVWAAELTANILCPAANMVGSWYEGCIQLGQLNDVSLRDLIEISGEV